ncbi:hypothetical protein [Tenacibaculum sp. 190524A02b]|uniref:hypothetical protein n=1 Tax=Tenacibaculum vairaonense TaxID=3137860 RepID=UPI0031FAC6FA
MNMLKLITNFLFVILCINAGAVQAQLIEKESVFGGYKYLYKEEKLNLKKLSKVVVSNFEASKLIKQAKNYKTYSYILAGTGVVLSGYSIAEYMKGNEINSVLTGVSGVLVVSSIVTSLISTKKTNSAVESYNNGIEKNTAFRPKVTFGVSSTGLLVSMNF